MESAETRVAQLFAQLKQSTSPELVAELQAAQAQLAELKVAEACAATRRGLDRETGGGEAAALELDALAASGVAPDDACYAAALCACLAAGELPLQAEWALLLYEEAAAAGVATPMATSLALRACARDGAFVSAEQVLATAASGSYLPLAGELEALLLCCADDADAEATSTNPSAEGEAARRLSRRVAQLLLPEWMPDGTVQATTAAHGALPALRFCGCPSASAVEFAIERWLRALVAWQVEVGPLQSVVSRSLDLALMYDGEVAAGGAPSPAEAEGEAEAAAEAAEVDNAYGWDAVLGLLTAKGRRAHDDASADEAGVTAGARRLLGALELRMVALLGAHAAAAAQPLATRRGEVSVGDRAAASVRAAGSRNGGEDGALSSCGRRRPALIVSVNRGALESYLRGECVPIWRDAGAALAARRRAEEAQMEVEREAREAAREAALAAALALQAKRDGRWARANERLSKERTAEERGRRTSLGVALDEFALRTAAEYGLDADTPTPAPPRPPPSRRARASSPAEAAAAAAAAAPAAAAAAARAAAPAPVVPAAAPAAAPAVATAVGDAAAKAPHPPPVDCTVGGDADVSGLPGIGPKRAAKLRAAGLATVADLAALPVGDVEAVASTHGLPLKSLRGWMAEAARHGLER